MDRRLAAILAADVAGYSRLIAADEVRTIQSLQGHFAAIQPLVAEHGGNIIDTAGDGFLAEFASTVSAVQCATAIQDLVLARNADIPSERRLILRIGINQGEVVSDQGRVYGDGINVAARLEQLAEPGGIAVSGRVVEDLAGKINVEWTDAGEHALKNIRRPV